MLSNKIEKLNPKKFEKYFSETTSKLKINSSDKKFARSDQLIELALGLSQNACKEFNKKLSELNEILPLLKNKLTNLNESLTKSDNMIPVICGPRRDFIFNYLSFRIKELKSNLPI